MVVQIKHTDVERLSRGCRGTVKLKPERRRRLAITGFDNQPHVAVAGDKAVEPLVGIALIQQSHLLFLYFLFGVEGITDHRHGRHRSSGRGSHPYRAEDPGLFCAPVSVPNRPREAQTYLIKGDIFPL
jgi:hypothetical protein